MEPEGVPESVSKPLCKYSLRFFEESSEQRFLLATESLRIIQMQTALILACLLYTVAVALDYYFLPLQVRELGISLHATNAIFLLVCSAFLFYSNSFNVRAAIVIVAVTVSWVGHLYFVLMSGATSYQAEGYLMLIWVWVVSGLSLRQGSKVILLFLIMFEIVAFSHSTLPFPEMMVHQYFVFVSMLIGGLGAYLAEYYKRQNFLSLERISEQKEQLAKDAAKLDRLSQALKQSGDAILITDKDAVVEYVNNAFSKMTGYASEEVVGKSPKDMKCEDQTLNVKEVMEIVAEAGYWDSLITAHRKDGTTYPALISVAPVFDKAGDISHYIYSHKDMTEHQRMESQLRHSQQMDAIGTLVGGIAHDFNNNLAGITGNMYLLKKKVEHIPEATSMLNTMNKLAYSTAKTVKQLLAYTRRGIVDFSIFDFSEMTNNQVSLMKVSLPAEVEVLYVHKAKDHLFVRGDSSLLLNAFVNLLNNAKDAVENSKRPKIKVVIEKWSSDTAFKRRNPDVSDENFVRVCVEDNGCGIEAKVMPRIFEPFFTTKGVDQGTGLGLSMVIGAVQSHHGVVEVRSEKGRGTSFYMYLPLSGTEDSLKPIEKNGDDIVFAGTQNTVLVVDDNIEVLRVVTALLDQLGYEVLQATDGLEAVEIFNERKEDISLVILDIVMPRMNGIEVKKEVRKKNAQVKVLFLTGYDPNQQDNYYEFESEEIMLKPFRVSELSQKIKELLSS